MSVKPEKVAVTASTTACFHVDAQKTFTPLCPDELPVPEGHLITDELNAMSAFSNRLIGSKDAHARNAIWVTDQPEAIGAPFEGRPYADHYWPVHAVVGTKGYELLDGLPHPGEYDFFVYKGAEPDMHPFGACYHDLDDRQSTGVIEYLRAQSIDTVLVGGLAYEFCLCETVRQLAHAGFRVIVVESATRGISEKGIAEARSLFDRLKGVDRVASTDLLRTVN